MKNLAVFLITAVFVILACGVAVSEEQRSAQMQEARELMRRLRALNQELREAISEARQSEEVAKAFARVGELREALQKAQQGADESLEKAIVAKNPQLAEKVAERKALRQKLQQRRGRLTRRGTGSPGRRQSPPDTSPSRPVEDTSAQQQDKQIIPTIVHFDIPADDVERARKFYTELFGWKIERTPGPMEYWMISVTEEQDEGAVNGGMMKRMAPEEGYRNYFGVPSVEDYAVKVKKLGGRVVVPKMPVPGLGYFAVCLDTENNGFAIWETDESAK